MSRSQEPVSHPAQWAQRMHGWLDEVEQHAAEASQLLRQGSLAAYPGCGAHLQCCIRGMEKLTNAAASDGGVARACDRALDERAARLGGTVRRLQGLHHQAASFYLRRLQAIAAACGVYAPGGWQAPAPRPRMRVEA